MSGSQLRDTPRQQLSFVLQDLLPPHKETHLQGLTTDTSKQLAAPVVRPTTCKTMYREPRNGKDKTGTGTGRREDEGGGSSVTHLVIMGVKWKTRETGSIQQPQMQTTRRLNEQLASQERHESRDRKRGA